MTMFNVRPRRPLGLLALTTLALTLAACDDRAETSTGTTEGTTATTEGTGTTSGTGSARSCKTSIGASVTGLSVLRALAWISVVETTGRAIARPIMRSMVAVVGGCGWLVGWVGGEGVMIENEMQGREIRGGCTYM